MYLSGIKSCMWLKVHKFHPKAYQLMCIHHLHWCENVAANFAGGTYIFEKAFFKIRRLDYSKIGEILKES